MRAADARLATVALRLQTANVALCPDVRRLPGFTVEALSQYDPAARPAVSAALGLGPLPAVAAIAPGSDAQRAGLQVGDTIARIDDTAAPLAAGDGYAQVARTEALIEEALAKGPLRLTLRRDGQERSLTVTGDRGCASRVQLVPGGGLNAHADGRYVQITGRMSEAAASDDELAVVTAHELSHNILGHRARLDAGHVSRGPLAGLGPGGAALRETEAEADRLSVWLIVRAGYDADAIVPFWQKIARRSGDFISDGTHPKWRSRLAALAAAVATVRAQQAAGAALVPPPQTAASQREIRR